MKFPCLSEAETPRPTEESCSSFVIFVLRFERILNGHQTITQQFEGVFSVCVLYVCVWVGGSVRACLF